MVRHGTRKVVLFAILSGVGAYVAFDSVEDWSPAQKKAAVPARLETAKQTAAGAQGTAPEAGGRRWVLPERTPLGEPRAELFGPHSWQPPVPRIASAPPAPSVPSVPPMPYRYAGKLVQGDRLSVLLSKGDTVFPIQQGETLDGAYRVESIGETQITLIYLPLRHKVSIPVVSSLPIAASAPRSDPAAAAGGGQTASAAAVPAREGTPTGTTLTSASPAGSPSVEGTLKADSGPARLLWEGPQQVKLGTRFEVALRVTSGQPLHASPMQLRFDPAYLEFVSAKPGKYFQDRNFSYRVNPDGLVFVGASNPSPAPASNAELFVLTFRPVKPAPVTELSVASLNLQGPAGRPIAFSQLQVFKTAISP